MFCPIRFIYTIQPGDSLYRIADIFKTTVHDILDMNPGLVANNLFIGTEITICPGCEFLEALSNMIYPPARPMPPVGPTTPRPVPPVGILPPGNITPPTVTFPPNNIIPPNGTHPSGPIMPYDTNVSAMANTDHGQGGMAQEPTHQYYRYN